MADDAPVIGGLLMAGAWWAEQERFASEAASLRALFGREESEPVTVVFLTTYERDRTDDIEELRRDVYADYESGRMDVGTLIGTVARLAGLRRRRLARALME